MWLSFPLFSIIPASCAEQHKDSCTWGRGERLNNLFTDTPYFSPLCRGYTNSHSTTSTIASDHGCYYYCQSQDLEVTERVLRSMALYAAVNVCFCVEWSEKCLCLSMFHKTHHQLLNSVTLIHKWSVSNIPTHGQPLHHLQLHGEDIC